MSKVIVFGSINLDLVTRVTKHPKPGETVIDSDYELLPGGKGANQALAAAKALKVPSNAILIGATGTDDFANAALANLSKVGVELKVAKFNNSRTGIAIIAVDENGENNIIVCSGANALVSTSQFTKIELSTKNVLLTQQEIPLPEVWAAHSMAKKSGPIVIHNAAPAASIPDTAFQNIDYMIVNASEAVSIGSEHNLKAAETENIAQQIANWFGVNVILTLGEQGVATYISGNSQRYPALPIDVVDTTGAGDVFCGTFAASIANGNSISTCIENSIVAASNACRTFGAQSPD